MDKYQKKPKKITGSQNILESLKDIGISSAKSASKDVLRQKAILEQLFGYQEPKKYSGEITPGEAVELKDVFNGRREQEIKLKKQLLVERNLAQEEKIRIEKKTNELRIQLHALIQEVTQLSQATTELSKEVKIAAMQAPVEPGIYHIIFFEKLVEFIKSFRKQINDASQWLYSINKRAQKKNYWASYKKHGGKFLLSAEHYLQRNAG